MTDIDYSKDDFIDVNNQLFRRSRNKIGDTSEPIKDMKDDEKAKEYLQIYGSEIINNLNQINYTFEQIDAYIFKPDKTKKGVNGQILLPVEQPNGKVKDVIVGPTITVSDIQYGPVRPTKSLESLPPEVLMTSDELDEDFDVMQGLIELADPELDYTIDEYDYIISTYEAELERQEDQGQIRNPKMLKDLEVFKFQRNREINKKKKMQEKEDQEDPTQPMTYYGKPATIKLPKPPPPLKPVEEVRLPKKLGVGKYSSLINADATKSQVKDIVKKQGNELNLTSKDFNKSVIQLKELILEKEKQLTGSGRKKKPQAKQPINVIEKPEVFEPLDEEPKDETQSNLTDAEKLDMTLVEVSKTSNQKMSVPSYISKIYELITSLIQFIGRTTVLYITKIKKNLNYLDEEQVKLIYNAIQPFKNHLKLLKEYNNSALIQTTLTKQLEKETLGLYNEINNSIRNYSKLKNYTTFSGAGRSFGSDMVGGFIEQPNDFINRTSTTRFL